jgi:hypothetical protein
LPILPTFRHHVNSKVEKNARARPWHFVGSLVAPDIMGRPAK